MKVTHQVILKALNKRKLFKRSMLKILTKKTMKINKNNFLNNKKKRAYHFQQ